MRENAQELVHGYALQFTGGWQRPAAAAESVARWIPPVARNFTNRSEDLSEMRRHMVFTPTRRYPREGVCESR